MGFYLLFGRLNNEPVSAVDFAVLAAFAWGFSSEF